MRYATTFESVWQRRRRPTRKGNRWFDPSNNAAQPSQRIRIDSSFVGRRRPRCLIRDHQQIIVVDRVYIIEEGKVQSRFLRIAQQRRSLPFIETFLVCFDAFEGICRWVSGFRVSGSPVLSGGMSPPRRAIHQLLLARARYARGFGCAKSSGRISKRDGHASCDR